MANKSKNLSEKAIIANEQFPIPLILSVSDLSNNLPFQDMIPADNIQVAYHFVHTINHALISLTLDSLNLSILMSYDLKVSMAASSSLPAWLSLSDSNGSILSKALRHKLWNISILRVHVHIK